MKRMLCVVLAMLLLPAIALAEEIHLLWDIPFPQSAYQFVRDAERIKGIKMHYIPFPAYPSSGMMVTETAKSAEDQDLQLFGIPFELEYSHTCWNLPERKGNTVYEYVTITFPSLSSSRYSSEELSAVEAFEKGLMWTETIWRELGNKYGNPSYGAIVYESNFSEWADGTASYISEVEALSQQDIEKLLKAPSSFVQNAREEYPYPSEGRSIKVSLYYGNIYSKATYVTYTDGSFAYHNQLRYDAKLSDPPRSYREEKKQKQPYSDTGL